MPSLASKSSTHKDRVRAFYDTLSPHFRALWGEHLHDGFYETGQETKEAAQEQLVVRLAEFAGLPKDARGLDVGCGMGASSVWLARNLDARMTGITLSPTQVEIARELVAREGVRADFQVADADRFHPGEPFDFVWMVGVLGHFEDQRAFVRSSGRLLRSGGRFLLADWVADPALRREDRRRFVEPVLEGMLMPDIATLDEYVTWFEENGYRVLDSRDLTKETERTWEEGVSISQAPDLARLAWSEGPAAMRLLAAIKGMRRAMAERFIRYGILSAEKL